MAAFDWLVGGGAAGVIIALVVVLLVFLAPLFIAHALYKQAAALNAMVDAIRYVGRGDGAPPSQPEAPAAPTQPKPERRPLSNNERMAIGAALLLGFVLILLIPSLV